MPCSGSRRRRPRAGKNAGKVYFVSQTGIAPPTFVCMCNDPKAFPKNYRRFLERKLRESMPFTWDTSALRVPSQAPARSGTRRAEAVAVVSSFVSISQIE